MDKGESIFWTAPAPERVLPEKLIAPLSNHVAERAKDSRFFSYVSIENPSKRPGASPRRKLKSSNFLTVKMRTAYGGSTIWFDMNLIHILYVRWALELS